MFNNTTGIADHAIPDFRQCIYRNIGADHNSITDQLCTEIYFCGRMNGIYRKAALRFKAFIDFLPDAVIADGNKNSSLLKTV